MSTRCPLPNAVVVLYHECDFAGACLANFACWADSEEKKGGKMRWGWVGLEIGWVDGEDGSGLGRVGSVSKDLVALLARMGRSAYASTNHEFVIEVTV